MRRQPPHTNAEPSMRRHFLAPEENADVLLHYTDGVAVLLDVRRKVRKESAAGDEDVIVVAGLAAHERADCVLTPVIQLVNELQHARVLRRRQPRIRAAERIWLINRRRIWSAARQKNSLGCSRLAAEDEDVRTGRDAIANELRNVMDVEQVRPALWRDGEWVMLRRPGR